MTFEIEGFTPLGVIGQGGFGTVHRAADDAHGREVAIKVLGRIADDSARRRFDRERRAMGTLSGHPTIGIVYTSGFTVNHEPYIVMEMIRGGSLADRLEKDGPLPPSVVVELGTTLAEALHHAHQGGVLHLDLKPENILMSRFGKPKIVDFGIAAIVDDESATSTIRATPSYADPHVLEGHPGTELSDVYGLAATLFTLLNGSPPYSDGPTGLYRVMQRVALDPVPTVERDDVSPALAQLLHRAMAKDPNERPSSMEEFERLLRDVDAEPATERRPSPRRVDRSQKSKPATPDKPKPEPVDGWPGQGERPLLPGVVDASNPVHRPDPAPPRGPSIVPVQPAEPQRWAPSVATPVATRTPTLAIPVTPYAPQQPNRDRTNRTSVAVLATLAVVLAAVLAFIVVRRGDDGGDPPSNTIGQEAATSGSTLAPADIAALATDDGTLPDVVGLATADAREVIRASGYGVMVPPHCFTTVESQLPPPGSVADENTVVALRFPPCIVPDFVGLRRAEAERIVEEDFVVGLRIRWLAHCDDLILDQSILANTVVEPGSMVILTLEDDCSGG